MQSAIRIDAKASDRTILEDQKGAALNQFLDSLHVEKYWQKDKRINWKTGHCHNSNPINKTHCSLFVAAAGLKLGIYILRPPEHKPKLLANAQRDWLEQQCKSTSPTNKWKRLANGSEAQAAANSDKFVVVSYKNLDPKEPGHIAIVRPGKKDQKQIESEGPDVIQAGDSNHNRVSLKKGFDVHDDIAINPIRYYLYDRKLTPVLISLRDDWLLNKSKKTANKSAAHYKISNGLIPIDENEALKCALHRSKL